MSVTGAELPRLDYFALGGTIASVSSAGQEGAAPVLSAEGILQSVPGVAGMARVNAVQFMQASSPEITLADLVRLHAAIRAAVAQGSRGVIVTQGTDTLEETAFVIDLLWDGPEPVVFTGAMRNPSLPGNDGPANLLAAIQVALGEEARNCGALIVFNDQIHSARFVHKTHTSNPATFQSPSLGPIGWVSEGRPMIAVRPTRRANLALPPDAVIPPVALIKMAMGDDARLLPSIAQLGYRGLVIESFGGGHMRAASLGMLRDLLAVMPVVFASRTGAGEVLAETYRFAGSELDLLAMGLIRSGVLDGLKARLLLSLCLAKGLDRPAMADMFRTVGMTHGPVLRAAE